MHDSSLRMAYTRSAEKYSRGGIRFVAATLAWLLVCAIATGVGFALMTGLVRDETAQTSPLLQGLAITGAAILALLAYYFFVIKRLADEKRGRL